MSYPINEELPLDYRLPDATWQLRFPTDSLAALASVRQSRWWSKESVGQLYTRDLTTNVIRIDRVTTVASRWAGRHGVRLDIPSAVRERKNLFMQGLHCVGIWHSHPEDVPHPSPDDLEMAADHARAGHPNFSGLVFAIVGRRQFPQGLGVWVHDGEQMFQADTNSSDLHLGVG